MERLKPLKQDTALLADLDAAARASEAVDNHLLAIWWLGQSGFLVQYKGKYVLFDPYLSDSLTEKYTGTDKPHVRISDRVIDPAWLPPVDVVTASHNHTDHLDASTLRPILANSPGARLLFPEANRAFVSHRLGIPQDSPTLVGLTDGQWCDLAGFQFYGVPAAHDTVERDKLGRPLYMGFVVKLGPFTLYHSGDTRWYESLVEKLRPFEVDVAFLPINGYKPERRVAGNLDPQEAAQLGTAIGAQLVVPHHYDLFAFNTADPADFEQACAKFKTPYRVLKLGERLTIQLR